MTLLYQRIVEVKGFIQIDMLCCCYSAPMDCLGLLREAQCVHRHESAKRPTETCTTNETAPVTHAFSFWPRYQTTYSW